MLHRIARRAAAITTIALLGACDTKSPAAPASQADSTTMEAAPSILRRSGLGVDLSTVVLPTGTVRALEASFSTRQRATAWTSSDSSLVRVDAAGRVTALGNGLATITARSLRNSQTWRVLGVDLATMRVEMEPRTIALQVGQNLSVDVSAETSTGLSLPTHTAEFSAENPSVALVLSSGRVFGVRPGTTRINMNLFGVTRSIPVTVGGGAADPTTPVLTSFALAPRGAITLAAGESEQFTATGAWSDNATRPVNVTYSASGGTITAEGLYTAPAAAGTYRVIGAPAGSALRDTAVVTVPAAPAVLTSLRLAPRTVTIAPRATQVFTTTALWSTGATTVPDVTFSTTGGSMNTTTRTYTAPSTPGTYRVIVAHTGGSHRDTAVVTVAAAAPTVTAFSMSPASATVAAGATRQFATSATWSDGASRAVTVAYSATGGTISGSGLYTAGTVGGSFRVIATCSCGLADTSAVTVTAPVSAPTATAFVLSPGSATIGAGATRQFSTATTWSDGASRAVTVSYQATGGSISVGGLYTAGQIAGTFAVIATCSCGRADTSAISITAPQLLSLSISPKTVTMNVNETRSFGASALWSTGLTTLPNITFSVIGGGGTINASTGAYQAPATAGTYRVVVAQVGGLVRDTAVITVQGAVTAPPPPPTTSDFTANMPTNQGLQLYTDTRFGNLRNGSLNEDGLAYMWSGRNATDNTSPFPPNVFETYYAGNDRGNGEGGASLYGANGRNWRKMYFALSLWVPADYSMHSNEEKFFYPIVTTNGQQTSSTIFGWYVGNSESPGSATWTLGADPQLGSSRVYQTSSVKLRKGSWQRVEYYMAMNTPGQSNGIWQVWINGQLAVNFTNMRYSNASSQSAFDGVRFEGVRGGGPSSTPTPSGGQVRRYSRLAFYGSQN